MASTITPWLVIYFDEPDIEYEEDTMPNHLDKNIKFIQKGDKTYAQASDGTGWCPIPPDKAESRMPFRKLVDRKDLEASVRAAHRFH